ncbi:MAG: cobyrinate a,c-diamide synthase, partial [Gammaproteobacteria bacterium]
GFYYPDDLARFHTAGAELVAFDTLNDTRLPDVDALLLGGGFPEVHLDRLEANVELRSAIRSAIAGGLPVYAECGGLMYLARQIRWGERSREMVGALPADVAVLPRPQGRGYVELEETGVSPWPFAPAGTIPAHEFHHSRLEDYDAKAFRYAYRVRRGHGLDGEHDGLIHENVLASYTHLRATARHDWTARFLAFVRECMAGRMQAQAI